MIATSTIETGGTKEMIPVLIIIKKSIIEAYKYDSIVLSFHYNGSS